MADWNRKIAEVDDLVAGGHYKQAIQEAGGVLEQMLRDLIGRVTPTLAPAEQDAVTKAQESVGKGKAIKDFTLGQIVGLLRTAKLMPLAEKALSRKLRYLSSANFNDFVELRNRATHVGGEVSHEEAQYFAAQTRLYAKELGLLETAKKSRGRSGQVGATALRPWTDLVRLHPDVESDTLTEAMFAIDLGAVAASDPNTPAVYRDGEAFFKATFLTTDLRKLLEEVLASLAGEKTYDRVLKLRTHFGGGKTHVLTALLHAARSRRVLSVIPEASEFADPGEVAVAVFDGEKFGAKEGKTVDGRTIHTMWGWIAWQFGLDKYALVEANDCDMVSPGGDLIVKLLEGEPKLILLDEVLKYVERGGAVQVHESTLQRQTLDFLQNLTVEVAKAGSNAVMVYSLQWSAREALGNIALLEQIDHLTSRVDQLREPVTGDEILNVLQKRLLGAPPPEEAAREVADAYGDEAVRMWRADAETPGEKRAADERGLELQQRLQAAYPFHPALVDVMKDRWSGVDGFQRTRGALRLLAVCLHSLKQSGSARALLGPAEIPLGDAEVRRSMLKDLDPKGDYYPVISSDIVGSTARAKQIDDRLAKETPAMASVRPATRLATAILAYSFGGLSKGDGEETLPAGVTETELLSACVGPDLDRITAQAVLSQLKTSCLYLHYDGVRYCFKKDPNVVKLVEDAEQQVARDTQRVEQKIKEMLQKRLAGKAEPILWPQSSRDLPDKEPHFLLAYLPLGFASMTPSEQTEVAADMLFRHGDTPRKYRNGVGVGVPDKRQIEPLRRAVRYLLAVEDVEKNKDKLRLSKDQMSQLKERRKTEESVAEGALRNLYYQVWLPRIDGGREDIEKVDSTGRTLQATDIHERCMELLTELGRKWVHGTVTPQKVIDRVKLGEALQPGEPPRMGIKTSDIVESFFAFLEPPRLTSTDAIRKAIAEAVEKGLSGYTSGSEPTLDQEGAFQVNPDKVFIGRPMGADEVDLETGFLMMPAAIPKPTAPEVSPGQPGAPDESTQAQPPVGPEPIGTEPGQARQQRVCLRFEATRDQIFKAFPAIANLADKSDDGTVSIEVVGTSNDGYDPSWMRNAVEEPLDEANIRQE